MLQSWRLWPLWQNNAFYVGLASLVAAKRLLPRLLPNISFLHSTAMLPALVCSQMIASIISFFPLRHTQANLLLITLPLCAAIALHGSSFHTALVWVRAPASGVSASWLIDNVLIEHAKTIISTTFEYLYYIGFLPTCLVRGSAFFVEADLYLVSGFLFIGFLGLLMTNLYACCGLVWSKGYACALFFVVSSWHHFAVPLIPRRPTHRNSMVVHITLVDGVGTKVPQV